MADPLTHPPSVDRVLTSEAGRELVEQFGRKSVTQALREQLDTLRKNLNNLPSMETLLADLKATLEQQASFSLKRLFNLSGTILHTNLGRAILPQSALARVVDIGGSASNLEYDLDDGQRGDRDSHIESLICELTGAEAATVVNNNAAAVLLVLNTLALGKEVPVSRGELVEIGGSFRIPEIMARSGCSLVEIGATNRTHLKDYQSAIGPSTALLLKVHTSNYEIRGFTNEVSETEITNLAHEHNLPFVTDLGSGSLLDLSKYGLPKEPTVGNAIENGADVVTFSGDKLLGGPQSGLIVGKKKYIDLIKDNPMKRALRVDKMTIAALFEVLRLYQDPDHIHETLPTLHHLTRPVDDIKKQAEALLDPIIVMFDSIADISIEDTESQIGSGSLPLELLPSKSLSVRPQSSSDSLLRELSDAFRQLPIPVVGRIHDGALFFDLRTLDDTAGFLAQLEQLNLPGSAS
jgi:L-seryl-tRNA(Ser) seleniumtransferase